MNSAQVRNAYQQSQSQAQIHPVKLIHLMYERILIHLELVEEGVIKKDPKLRGENMGRVIALVTELNASIKEDDDSEAASFLRGLYAAILVELPKVLTNHDVEVVRQASRYITKLKGIWEETAMLEAGFAQESGHNGSRNERISSQLADAKHELKNTKIEGEGPAAGNGPKGTYDTNGTKDNDIEEHELSVSI